jgi:primosomal protein N' (replication factor Y) (superfamily II helicase)
MQIVRVVIPQSKLFPLDYIIPDDTNIQLGQLVVVPFRNKKLVGIIVEKDVPHEFANTKAIIGIWDNKITLTPQMLQFMKRASEYYMEELGSITKLVLPIDLLGYKNDSYVQEFNNISLPSLSNEQQSALLSIEQNQGVSVLHGITGSGKTEIYFYLLHKALNEGKQSLLMLPEISLSKQILHRFQERFGSEAVIWNSSITPFKKRKILLGIMSGSVKIVIGTRSALFLPYHNLANIIVDEEHDASYKQDDNILYNARDMAILRGHLEHIPVLLGSATPSLETFSNTMTGRYLDIKLNSRFGEASLPNVIAIDMRKRGKNSLKNKWISEELKEAIHRVIESGEQVLLFLNRKGYAPLIVCSTCGHRACCSACSTSLVYHKSTHKLLCHHCGYNMALYTDCIDCKTENSMVPCGPGVERIFEEVSEYFPEHKIQIMTKDEMNTTKKANTVLSNIMNGSIDIIIGTQIITKGYHFPKLTLVGVVDIDLGLSGGDLRSAEKTFQLLYQVGGRAGREKIKGTMYIQTYNPESKLIQLLKEHNFDKFMRTELAVRKDALMPPETRMAAIIISDKDETLVQKISSHIIRKLPKSDRVTVLGPVAAILSKVKNKYRYRILLIADKKYNLQSNIASVKNTLSTAILNKIKIDIDPYNFY